MNILPRIQPVLVRRTIIDGSVRSIKSVLSQVAKGGAENDSPITKDDVDTIAQGLQSLSSQDTSDLMSSLSDEGLLDDLAKLLNEKDVGLDDDKKILFFNNLASKVNSGSMLAEISNSFAKLDLHSAGIDDVEGLAKAISQYANSRIKVAYVEAIAPRATDKTSYTEFSLLGGARTHFGDAEAFAIAHVVSSLANHSSAVTDVLELLNGEQLKAVMLAGIDMKQYFLNVVGPTAMLNASLASKVLSAASKTQDAELKTIVFQVGAEMLDYINHHMSAGVVVIGKSAAAEAITHALTSIVESDPVNILRELANSTEPDKKQALVTYTRQMLQLQQGYQLVDQIAGLQRASGLLDESVVNLSPTLVANNEIAELIEPIMPAMESLTDVKNEAISELTDEVAAELGDKAMSQVNEKIATHLDEQIDIPLNDKPELPNQAIDTTVIESTDINLNSDVVNDLASQVADELSSQVVEDIANDLGADLDEQSLNQLTAEITAELTEQVAEELNNEVVNELTEQLMEEQPAVNVVVASNNSVNDLEGEQQALINFLESIYTSAQALVAKDQKRQTYTTLVTVIDSMLRFMRSEIASEGNKELRKAMSSMLEYLQIIVNKDAASNSGNIYNEIGSDGAKYTIDRSLF